jgi:hypothetical protein
VVGIWDLGSMILMFGINAIDELLRVMMERSSDHRKNGLACFRLWKHRGYHSWIVIVLYFLSALSSSDCQTAAFVYAIITDHLCVLRQFRDKYASSL